jgi:hypothetical protein
MRFLSCLNFVVFKKQKLYIIATKCEYILKYFIFVHMYVVNTGFQELLKDFTYIKYFSLMFYV